MQPGRIVEPDDQGPGFLGVPAPVAAPGLGGPEGAQDGGDGEEGKAQGDGLVHQVVQGGQVGQACGQGLAQGHGQHEEHHQAAHLARPAVQADHGLGRQVGAEAGCQDGAHQGQGHADQADHQGPGRGRLEQIGHGHHGREGEGAVADEVGRHMDLHPPALQGRHQGLDLVRLARHRVPEQEGHGRADHQQHVGAQGASLEAGLVVQIEQRRHPGEQHEDFVEIADRDVADIGCDLVALEPAHHGTHQGHEDGAPGQLGADGLGRAGLALLGEEAAPVEQGAHVEEQAHPQDRALAGQHVLEQEDLVGRGQIGAEAVGGLAVEVDGQQAGRTGGDAQAAQRTPEPAQGDQRRHGEDQDAFLVAIHGGAVAAEGEQTAGHDQGGEDPVHRVAAVQRAAAAQDDTWGGACGIHTPSFNRTLFSCSNSVAVSGDSRVLDRAMRTRVVSG
eukprot:Opistho-2@24198